MKSRVVLLVTALCVIPAPLSAQTAAKFEVASIKPAPTALEMMRAGTFAPPGPVFSGTRVTIARMAMRELIATAYGIDVQKVTGPSWIIEKNFAIQATMPEGASKDQFPQMLRSLLEDRFHLSAKLSTADMPALALTVAKGGHKMKPAGEPDRSACDPWRDIPAFPGAKTCTLPPNSEGVRVTINTDSKNGPTRSGISRERSEMEFYAVTMPQLADYLTTQIMSGPNRNQMKTYLQVIDRTGLDGKWHLTVERAFTDAAMSAPDGPVTPMQITPSTIGDEFTSGVKKMGLNLEKITAPLTTVAVESIDQTPTEN